MPWPTITQADKPHSLHVGSLAMLRSSLARPLLLLGVSIVSRLRSSLVKNKKRNWKEENPTLGMLFALTISFPDNYRVVRGWVGHIYAAKASTLPRPAPSNLHFTHITRSFASVDVHQHPRGLTPLLGRLPLPRSLFMATSPRLGTAPTSRP